MPKSNPLPSNTVLERPPTRNRLASEPAPKVVRPSPASATPLRSLNSRIAAAIRWLHIYVSLVGFTALVFFAVTGITLNHPGWFGNVERSTTTQGALKLEWVAPTTEGEAAVAKLEVVEHLRSADRVRGALSEFRVDDAECLVVFKGPGYAADVYIDRQTGKYELTETSLGAVAVINDLHKGRDTGLAWSLVLDITAVLMIFVSITGMWLLFYLKRRRVTGVITALVGTIVFVFVYFAWVP